MGGSLPRLMKLYDTYEDRRDKFEILAFHDGTVKSFAELDQKMERVVETRWEGRSLPFPTLLDATGATVKDLGIRAFPTHVLLDPEGRIVKGDEKAFEKILREELGPQPSEEDRESDAEPGSASHDRQRS